MNRPDCADAFETKSADAADDLAGAFEEFMTSFEAFKEANDARLAEIERRAAADPVTTEKVERISRALDEQKRVIDDIALKRVRPLLLRDDTPSIAALEHMQAFEAYMRSGDGRSLRGLEEKTMSYSSTQDGGYQVPD